MDCTLIRQSRQQPGQARYDVLLPWVAVLAALILVPLRIIGYGYMPADDALRHAAKAVSGKSWSEILVLSPAVKMDEHPGWHALLGALHRFFGFGTDALVLLPVATLLLLFLLSGLPWVRRPEHWAGALLILALTSTDFVHRISLGRPLVLWMAVEVFLVGLWTSGNWEGTRAKAKYAMTVFLLALMSWLHGTWYLFLLPVAAFFLAGQFGRTWRLGLCLVTGALIGAIMTGRPVTFLSEHVMLVFRALGQTLPQHLLVPEFKPHAQPWKPVIVVAVALGVLAACRRPLREVVRDPVFLLVVCAWLMGLRVARMWTDWGTPALALWLARQAPAMFCERRDLHPAFKSASAVIVAIALFLAISTDKNRRWSTVPAATLPGPSDQLFPREWLPRDRGIIYSASMRTFFELFYRYPKATWRYVLGYEPGLMPSDNYVVFENIQRNGYLTETVAPWLQKMTENDRFVIISSGPPALPSLEWQQYRPGMWFGRLAR